MATSLEKLRNSSRATGPACVLAIGTAVPPHCYSQSDYTDFYFSVCKSEDKTQLKNKMRAICDRSGIRQRFLHYTKDILNKNPSMCEFNAPSLEARKKIASIEVPKLGVKAAEKAIEEWGQDKSKITHLVFTTSTGGNDTPSADFQFMRLFGLNPSVSRTMVYQQGCFAGATALRLAKDFAENNKGARVLVVSSEIFAFAFRGPNEEQLDSLIVQLLFGDAAGACIVGADPDETVEKPIYQLASTLQTVIPNSSNAVHLQMNESGLIVNLSKEVSKLIGDKMEDIMLEAFEPLGITDWNSIFLQIHPGGRAILDEVEKKLNLKKEKLRDSRFILSEYGNLISACVFFVMDEMRKRSIDEGKSTTGEGFEWGAVIGLGPGITVEAVILKSVPIP